MALFALLFFRYINIKIYLDVFIHSATDIVVPLNNTAESTLVPRSCHRHAGAPLAYNLGKELPGQNMCTSSILPDNAKLFAKSLNQPFMEDSPCCFTSSKILDIVKFCSSFQFGGCVIYP